MTLHLGLLRISPQHRYFVQTSVPSFFPSFLLLFYLFSKWNIYFFILVFSDPTLFCLLLFQSSTFPHLSFSFCLFLSLSPASFLDVFYLTPLTFFVYSLLSLSGSVSFFVCLLLSFFYFLSVFCYIPLTLLFIFLCVLLLLLSTCPYFLYLLSFSLLSAFSVYFSIFFSLFSYFFLFSTLFNYLFLMIGFNYCNFPLLFL